MGVGFDVSCKNHPHPSLPPEGEGAKALILLSGLINSLLTGISHAIY